MILARLLAIDFWTMKVTSAPIAAAMTTRAMMSQIMLVPHGLFIQYERGCYCKMLIKSHNIKQKSRTALLLTGSRFRNPDSPGGVWKNGVRPGAERCETRVEGREICCPVPSAFRNKNPVEGAFKSIEMGFELPYAGIE